MTGGIVVRNVKKICGFSLLELLIVVVIIGILATLAIPYFSAYRIKGYNSAAMSDLGNFKIQIEAHFAEHRSYPEL